jgi:hypothetical protein
MRLHRIAHAQRTTTFRPGVLTLLAALSCSSAAPASTTVEEPISAAVPAAAAPAAVRVEPSFGRLPVSFEPNVGQAPANEKFIVAGAGVAALTSTGAILNGGSEPVTLEFVGASTSASMAGTNELAGKANYLVGDDPSAWKTNVPTYSSVHVEQLYAGVDLVWYGKGRSLEYDLVLEAGADPGNVSFKLDGAPAPKIATDGAIVAGDVRLERPVAYQEVDGERRMVPSGYVTDDDGRVGFRLGDYDHSLPLVIDPEIGYTYTFADSSKDISIFGIAVDSTGAAYVAGRTRTEGSGGVLTVAAFVAKLNPEGTALVYSTTISGSAGNEEARDIAVDATGNAFITGFAFSSNFPTTAGAFQTTKGSPNGTQDAFVAKLGPAGDAFVYSSFLGGSGGTSGNRIAIDASGNAFVTGFTQSSNFPTTAPSQGTFGGVRDAFLTKVNPAGNVKVYSTYLGGTQSDTGNDVAVDASGNAYIVGVTTSTNFPVTAGTIQATNGGGSDGFWAKYDPAGQRAASTFLGGAGFDSAGAVAVDAAGISYLTGETDSAAFPLVSPFQASLAGDRDVFLSALNAQGTALVFSSLFGGSDWDYGTAIALDAAGRIYVTGTTRSRNLPVVNPVQAQYGGGTYDAFVLQVLPGAAGIGAAAPQGPAVGSATYHGGSGSEGGMGVGVTGSGQAIVGSEHPKMTNGGHDESDISSFIFDEAAGPDLFVRIEDAQLAFMTLNQAGERRLALYIQVRSDYTCENVLVPDAVFGLEIPLGLVLDVAGGKDGSRLVSAPPVNQPGVVTFALDRPVTHSDDRTDGAFVLVKFSRTTPPQGFVQVDAFAETSVPECSYRNNTFPGIVNPKKLYDFSPGKRLLNFVPLSDPSSPPIISIYGNAVAGTSSSRIGNRAPAGGPRYNVYSATQPGVQPIPANLFATVSADEPNLDVSEAPPNAYFVVTTVTDSGESARSNEVGGVLPEVTKLKVSATKIVAQGTGFASDVRVSFGGVPFATAPKLKDGNTKVVQKGRLTTDQTLGDLLDSYLTPGSTLVVLFMNGDGNAVGVEYTR